MAHGRSPRHKRARKSAARAGPDSGVSLGSGGPTRLQRVLAAAGVASRRGAEVLLREGRVRVNGHVAELGASADPLADRIEVDGERIRPETPRYWLVHKPAGVVTTRSDPEGRATILDLLPKRARGLFPVGRLDLGTEGLVLLTNDGPLTHTLLHPSLGNEREYRVTVRGDVPEKILRRLARGVRLREGPTGPAKLGPARFEPATQTTTFSLTLTQGRKRQIRRTLSFLGHPVRRLVRVRMGPLRLGRLPAGEARQLRSEELRALRQHVARLDARVAGESREKA